MDQPVKPTLKSLFSRRSGWMCIGLSAVTGLYVCCRATSAADQTQRFYTEHSGMQEGDTGAPVKQAVYESGPGETAAVSQVGIWKWSGGKGNTAAPTDTPRSSLNPLKWKKQEPARDPFIDEEFSEDLPQQESAKPKRTERQTERQLGGSGRKRLLKHQPTSTSDELSEIIEQSKAGSPVRRRPKVAPAPEADTVEDDAPSGDPPSADTVPQPSAKPVTRKALRKTAPSDDSVSESELKALFEAEAPRQESLKPARKGNAKTAEPKAPVTAKSATPSKVKRSKQDLEKQSDESAQPTFDEVTEEPADRDESSQLAPSDLFEDVTEAAAAEAAAESATNPAQEPSSTPELARTNQPSIESTAETGAEAAAVESADAPEDLSESVVANDEEPVTADVTGKVHLKAPNAQTKGDPAPAGTNVSDSRQEVRKSLLSERESSGRTADLKTNQTAAGGSGPPGRATLRSAGVTSAASSTTAARGHTRPDRSTSNSDIPSTNNPAMARQPDAEAPRAANVPTRNARKRTGQSLSTEESAGIRAATEKSAPLRSAAQQSTPVLSAIPAEPNENAIIIRPAIARPMVANPVVASPPAVLQPAPQPVSMPVSPPAPAVAAAPIALPVASPANPPVAPQVVAAVAEPPVAQLPAAQPPAVESKVVVQTAQQAAPPASSPVIAEVTPVAAAQVAPRLAPQSAQVVVKPPSSPVMANSGTKTAGPKPLAPKTIAPPNARTANRNTADWFESPSPERLAARERRKRITQASQTTTSSDSERNKVGKARVDHLTTESGLPSPRPDLLASRLSALTRTAPRRVDPQLKAVPVPATAPRPAPASLPPLQVVANRPLQLPPPPGWSAATKLYGDTPREQTPPNRVPTRRPVTALPNPAPHDVSGNPLRGEVSLDATVPTAQPIQLGPIDDDQYFGGLPAAADSGRSVDRTVFVKQTSSETPARLQETEAEPVVIPALAAEGYSPWLWWVIISFGTGIGLCLSCVNLFRRDEA